MGGWLGGSAVGGRVRTALKSKSCRRAAIIVAGSATGAFCALEASEGYGVRSPAMTHVLVCFGIEGISQAVMAAGFKKTFNNLAGRSKTLVFLALNVLRVEGQSPVERGGLRCFTAFLGFSAVQELEEISGVASKEWSLEKALERMHLEAQRDAADRERKHQQDLQVYYPSLLCG